MDYLPALILFAVTSTITPGPNNIMILSSGLNFGIYRSLPHYLGICLGFTAMVFAVGLGLGAVFEQYPVLHQLIKVAGVLYLLYLAWLIAHSTSSSLESDTGQALTFFQAALFQWVNPKAWVMVTGAVAAYTSVSVDIYWQVIVITLVFFIASFPCVGVWLIFGVGLRKLLTTVEHQKIFNFVMAVLLVLSVLPIVYDLLLTLVEVSTYENN